MDKITRLKNAIRAVNAEHDYVPDSGDSWDVNAKGDCEDYSFAVIWTYCGKSRWRFVWEILFGDFSFWFVKAGPGPNDGHFVTEYTPDVVFFDNSGALRPRASFPSRWVFVKKYWKLRVLFMIAFT